MKIFFLLIVLGVLTTTSFAEDEAAFQPGRVDVMPVNEVPLTLFEPFEIIRAGNATDLATAFAHQTPVKSQGSRGTCSIFSATAIVESLIKIHYKTELDLSESYLQYLVMSRLKPVASEGSDIPSNIPAIQRWGTVTEMVWPYENLDWNSSFLPEEEAARKQSTCGHLTGDFYARCLLAHRDPTVDPLFNDAAQFRANYSTHRLRYFPTNSFNQIRSYLNAGWPLVLSAEVFYGAWNHRKMIELGIGERDMKAWEAGVVSIPTERDITLSRTSPAGHSIVIIGYDDSKRVYYFKNSWGTSSFGVKSDFFGEGSSAGYGTISYDYAHRFGTFYIVSYQ